MKARISMGILRSGGRFHARVVDHVAQGQANLGAVTCSTALGLGFERPRSCLRPIFEGKYNFIDPK